MKYRQGQEVIFVGPVTNDLYDGPPPGSKVTITEAPGICRGPEESMGVEIAREWYKFGEPIYRFNHTYLAWERCFRPIDNEPAEEEFQNELSEWLSPREVANG